MSKNKYPLTIKVGIFILFLCAFIISVSYFILTETTYLLIIENNSTSAITDITIETVDINKCIESIKSKKSARLRFSFNHDGNLTFEAQQNNIMLGGTIEGYVTGSMSGKTTLIFNDNGLYEIKHEKTLLQKVL